MTFILFSIILDSRQLADIAKSTSLFIYTANNNPEIGVAINFSQVESQTLTQEQTKEAFDQVITKDTQLKKTYFKTFIFSESAINELLAEEVKLNQGITVSKKEILDGMASADKEESAAFFTTAVLDIFQNLQNGDKMAVFLKKYKNKEIIIYPKIKAISILSVMPEDMVKRVMSKTDL